jgi:hypothetical protein
MTEARNFLKEDHWSKIADDYGTLTADDFDAKYPGWFNSEVFDRELRAEFDRRRNRLDALPDSHV